MKYLNVDKLDNIESCKILNGEDLSFENGLAIAHVLVNAKSINNNDYNYETYTVIREVRDENTNEIGDYELANQEDTYFKLHQFVKRIIRIGSHFFFEVSKISDDPDMLSVLTNYYLYDYDEQKQKFTIVDKLDSMPTLTKNPDLVILNGSQLYSLSRKQLIGGKYTSIEDIDGIHFFVVDHITTKNSSSLHDDLMFDIDKDGSKVSKVFSKNKGDWTDDNISVPYEEVKEREIKKLEDKLIRAGEYKLLLKSSIKNEQ